MKEARRQTYYPIWVEKTSFDYWVRNGAITITDIGEENTYAINEFGQQFFCKH